MVEQPGYAQRFPESANSRFTVFSLIVAMMIFAGYARLGPLFIP